MKQGYVHSVETFGAVDGPGIRFVVFMQGCLLKCLYCHNADTWKIDDGNKITSHELFDQISQYRNFICKGGVTFSGGEPLIQSEFICEVIKLCKQDGLHTAIDTSGGVPLIKCKNAIDKCDMILLDIKDIDTDDCKILTGMGNENAFEILDYCEKIKRDVWIRHVVVPKFTLNFDKLERLAKKLSSYTCVKKVELNPFHKMGEHKWEHVGVPYTLNDIKEPTLNEMKNAKEIFLRYEL